MPVELNVVSEVRQFTTLSGRTVYVLDGQSGFDLDALVAACNSKACAPPPVGTGGSLPSGSGSKFAPKNRANPDASIGNGLEVLNNPDSLAVKEGFIDNMEKLWRTRMPKNPSVRTRVPISALEGIAKDKKFKTQHETETSQGLFDPEFRERVERRMFGSALREFPFYGYMAERGGRSAFGEDNTSSAGGYGDIVIEFKPEVNQRTTMTLGDSFASKLAPLPVDDIWNVSKERRYLATGSAWGYIEAQIHDPLTVKDVERIYVWTGTLDFSYQESLGNEGDTGDDRTVRQALTEMFPDAEIVGVDDLYESQQFSVCELHEEFACDSKECAPPPVGRGGSRPTQLSRGVRIDVPVGRLWEALVLSARGDKTPLIDLFSEHVMGGNIVNYKATREAGRSWSKSDDTAKRFAWDKVYDGSMVGESNGRHVARKVGKTWTIRIPLVLRGRPEIGKSDDWTGASSRDLNWWAEQEGEVRISKGAKIKLDGISVALPSRKQLERILAMTNPREIIDIFGGEDTSPWVDLDMPLVLTASVCAEHGEFACNSKSCAPPPVGTGGSLPTAVQHVTSREAAALIKKGGFLVGRGEMHGSLFGNGIYLSMAGDKMATDLYRSGTRKEGHEAALVKGTVRLKRPLKVSGDTKDEVFKDLVNKLGGKDGVIEAATNSYERLREGAKTALKKTLGEGAVKRVDWDGEFETDPVFNDMTSEQYADFVAAVNPYLPHGLTSFGDLTSISYLRKMMGGSAVKSSWTRDVSNLVVDLGYDGIEITNRRFSAEVGGSQIVVFDPKAITVESVEDFGALIERFGIEVTIDYVPSTVVCAEHGEFACNSKACAPPPIGSGGSLPSGSGRWSGGDATVSIAPKSPLTLTESDVTPNSAETKSQILYSIGAQRESYPDDFKVSQLEAESIAAVANIWIHEGVDKCRQLRSAAEYVLQKGLDVAADTKGGGLTIAAGVARTLIALRSAPKTTVWRGLSVSQSVLDQWKVGETYSEVLATGTGRKQLAVGFSEGMYSANRDQSGNVPVLLKMSARNIPIGGSSSGGRIGLADERLISGDFRIVSVKKEQVAVNRYINVIEVEQIDGD